MTKLNNGIVKVIESNCPVGADVMFNANIGQLTVYLDETIDQNIVSRLQTIIAKYIGDNLLQDSYKTVKIFN